MLCANSRSVPQGQRSLHATNSEASPLQARNRAQSSVYSMGGNAGSMTGMSEMTNLMTGQQQQSGAIQQVPQDQNSQALGFDGAGLGYLQPGLIGTGIVCGCANFLDNYKLFGLRT